MKTKFERVSLLPPYVFSEINNIKAKENLSSKDKLDEDVAAQETELEDTVFCLIIDNCLINDN